MAQLSQTGQAAGYRQEEIVAAFEDLASRRQSRPAELPPARTVHVSIPPPSGDQVPGQDQANLAAAHRDEYLRTGDAGGLERASWTARQAVELMPPDSPWLSPTLGLLGELMVESFTKTGAL